jgi:hypothetical protein
MEKLIMEYEIQVTLNNGDKFSVGDFKEIEKAVAVLDENKGKFISAEVHCYNIATGKVTVLNYKETK